MTAYYNEIDPYAAQWLRNLIAAGLIADGVVDERSITDVRADELREYTQCHFFAGIGGWSRALELARWPSDRPVWTGSCPCQPFSAAGKQLGTADERHLWPVFADLIRACKPPTVFGEQVASKAGREWLAGVFADLEGMGYHRAGADLCAAGVGAPHIRQRLFWVADAKNSDRRSEQPAERAGERWTGPAGSSGQGHAEQPGLERHPRHGNDRDQSRWIGTVPSGSATEAGRDGGVEYPARDGRVERRTEPTGWGAQSRRSTRGLVFSDGDGRESGQSPAEATGHRSSSEPAGGTNFWSAYDLIPCADGKARRIEPGTFPLAHGVPARMGKLRAYGNAISPEVAQAFIAAAMRESCI